MFYVVFIKNKIMTDVVIEKKTHKLMIKIHLVTNLKYLCYTQKDGEEYNNYKGSGKNWIKHLKKHGENIKTELIFETENYNEFKNFAIKKSIELNIVESKEWANLKIESGDGGDTVSNRMWITNKQEDKYILKTEEIPEGWKKGRTNCVFKDSNFQSQFSKKQSYELRSKLMKECWDMGKMEVKKEGGRRGATSENNPAKNPETAEKISKKLKEFYLTEKGLELRELQRIRRTKK